LPYIRAMITATNKIIPTAKNVVFGIIFLPI